MDINKIKAMGLEYAEKGKNVALDLTEKGKNVAMDLTERGKTEVRILNDQAKLAKAQRQLGALVYSLAKGNEENQPLVDKYIDAISAIEQEIDQLKATLTPAEAEEVTPEEPVEAATTVRTCPQCGVEVADDALFCNKCGAQL